MDIPSTIFEQLKSVLLKGDSKLPSCVWLFDDKRTKAIHIEDWYFVFQAPSSERVTLPHAEAPSPLFLSASDGGKGKPTVARFQLWDDVFALGVQPADWTPMPLLIQKWGLPPTIVQEDWRTQLGVLGEGSFSPNCILVAKDGTLAAISLPMSGDVAAGDAPLFESSNRKWHDSQWPWDSADSPQPTALSTDSLASLTVFDSRNSLARAKRNSSSTSKKMHRTKHVWIAASLGGCAVLGGGVWMINRLATGVAGDNRLATVATGDDRLATGATGRGIAEELSTNGLALHETMETDKGSAQDGDGEMTTLTTIDNSMSNALGGLPSTQPQPTPIGMEALPEPWNASNGRGIELTLSGLLGANEDAKIGTNAPLLDDDKIASQWLPQNEVSPNGESLPLAPMPTELEPITNPNALPEDGKAANPDQPAIEGQVLKPDESLESGITRFMTLDAARAQKTFVIPHKLFPKDARCNVRFELSDNSKKNIVVEPTGTLEIASQGKVSWVVAIEDEEPEILIEFYSKPSRRWEVMVQVGFREERNAPARLLAPKDAQNVVNQIVAMKQMVQHHLEQNQLARDAGARRGGSVDLYEQKRQLIARDKELDRALERWKVIEKLSYFVFDYAKIEYQMKTVRSD